MIAREAGRVRGGSAVPLRRGVVTGDGVPTVDECGVVAGTCVRVTTTRTTTVNADDDMDGVPTSTELGGSASSPRDTDRDGAPDFRDEDDDGDGALTSWERTTGSGSSCTASLCGRADADGDGVANYLDTDDDDDGVLSSVECVPSSGVCTRNSDGVGRRDAYDGDDDGDGLLTTLERAAGLDPSLADTDDVATLRGLVARLVEVGDALDRAPRGDVCPCGRERTPERVNARPSA